MLHIPPWLHCVLEIPVTNLFYCFIVRATDWATYAYPTWPWPTPGYTSVWQRRPWPPSLSRPSSSWTGHRDHPVRNNTKYHFPLGGSLGALGRCTLSHSNCCCITTDEEISHRPSRSRLSDIISKVDPGLCHVRSMSGGLVTRTGVTKAR